MMMKTPLHGDFKNQLPTFSKPWHNNEHSKLTCVLFGLFLVLFFFAHNTRSYVYI